MSQGLNKVKKRIATVEATKKITSAMKLVSSVKFSRLLKQILNRQDYYAYLNEVASTCFSAAKVNHLDIPYIKKNTNSKKRIVVVISSSMGMCGAYNINIKKLLDNEFKNDDELIIIGHNLIEDLKDQNLNINTSFADIFKDLDISQVKNLSNYLIDKFENQECKEIILIYTKYLNSISFVPKKVSVLPVEFKVNKKLGLNPGDFEPNLLSFSKEFIRRFIATDLYFKIFESYLSEVASRRNAMDNADKNAEELIDKLTLEFNKARQAGITQELTEVVNGSLNK